MEHSVPLARRSRMSDATAKKRDNMDSADINLGEFVQQLLLHLGERQLHFKDERPWHELFYRLKMDPDVPNKPHFFSELFFDWNGEYPKSQELSDYLHALHWTGCMDAANPTYDRIPLNQEVANLWRTDQVDPDLDAFITNAARMAETELAL